MVFLGFFTFLVAIQTHFKTTFLIYLTGSISFLIFLLIPVCLAVMLVIIISRFIPFVQSRGMLAVIGLLTGSILLSAIRVMQPEQLVTAEGKMRLVTFVQNLYKPWMTALPSEWVTNILFAQSQNNFIGIMVNFLSLFIVAFLLVLIVYVVAKFFYKRTWADAVVMSPAVHKEVGWQIMLRVFPYSLRGLIRKDLLSFNRNTMEKGSLLILIPLGFVYLYSMYVLNRHIQNVNEEQIFSFLYVYLFNFFYASVVISGLSGRWVLPSVSSEGNNFKLIKKSSTSLKDFLKAKFFLGFIPLLLLGQMLILCSSFILHLQFYFVLVSVFTMGILCWGITLISLIIGMSQADFSITSPLDFALSMKGFLCLTWELVFVITILISVGIPTALILYRGFSPSFILALTVSLSVTFIILMILCRVYKSNLIRLSRKEV
jgi:ABC-2 type transport system permease protein